MDTSGIIKGRYGADKRERAKELRQRMTPAEITLWKHLRTDQLADFHFRRQQIIDGFIVDFFCWRAGLIVEVDGDVHATQMEADTERDRVLAARGLHILRFSNDRILSDLDSCLDEILTVARSRHD
jgi:very-short-patch-repair endonuclease